MSEKDKCPQFLIKARTAVRNPEKKLYCPYCQQNHPLKIISGYIDESEFPMYSYDAEFKCEICGRVISYQQLRLDIDEAISHYETFPEVKIVENLPKHSPLLGQDYYGQTLHSSEKSGFGYAMHFGGMDAEQGIVPHGRH